MSQIEVLSPEKRAQILRGAAAMFTENGYEGASMSRIAAEAGVSKGTLYNYFESKADMFTAWVGEECAAKLSHLFDSIDADDTPEAALRGIGLRMVGMMLCGAGETIYRLVVAEAGKFPELAQRFFDAGPSKAVAILSTRLADETRRGRLAVDDPDFAAEQFFSLCQTRIVMRRKLNLRETATDAEVAHVVDQSVRMFLRTYGPNPH